MRILITGATGFVGSNITKELSKTGHQVIASGRDDEQGLPKNILFINRPFYTLNFKKIGRIDALIHQAAIVDTTLEDRNKMNFVNNLAARDLFEKFVKNGCKKIVYASSTAVYGNSKSPYVEGIGEFPLNEYGKSKLFLDNFVRDFLRENGDVSIIGLRYCNVFGPGESHKGKMASMVYQIAQQMKKGNPKIYKYGEQKRDMIYVKDVVHANLLALSSKNSGIVNCGTGKPVSFNEIISSLNDVLDLNRIAEYIENQYEGRYQNSTECYIENAREVIGFSPSFSFREGLEDYLKSGFIVTK